MRLVCEHWAYQIRSIFTKLRVLRTRSLVRVYQIPHKHMLTPCLVAEKLKQEGRHEIFEQETMEELEDDEGNVYNRKTYEDLKKQGLI